jgi:hypothetical protein
MTDRKDLDEALSANKSDYVATAAKAALGAVPFAGSLLAELAGTVIPNQRVERIVKFARELDVRISGLEQTYVRTQLSNENFTDLMEDALRQAARSTSDERRQHIASVIANSLTPESISFIESKHLLRILGEINDIEVIVLRSYLNATIGGDEEFRAKHEEALRRTPAHMESTQADLDKNALQESYRQHLIQLELLEERFDVDSKTNMPVFDRWTGKPKVRSRQITYFGRLLLRQVGLSSTP